MPALTFVTPVFEAEVQLLGLQARSFARHAPSDARVVVLDNTRRGLREVDALVRAYGALAPRVRVLRPADVTDLPTTSGWRSQQILKLAVARLVETPHYVALDAKNHFVARPDDAFFVAADGRARVRAYSYTDHTLRPALERVCRYLGLDPAEHVGRFAATTTPFTLDREVVLAMLADVESAAGRPFAREFLAHDLTEFFLYAGWLARRDGTLERTLELTDEPNPVVWPRLATPQGVRAVLDAGRDLPVLGLHRDAVPRLDPQATAQLAGFWAERGLVDAPADGVALVASMRARYDRERRRRQIRELPARVLNVGRRALARVSRR
ncbi:MULTISPECIES: DUF6492 family protein [Cellulomonas]|uniref:DUF6492 family protein n=1 Tax=Cellulomonas TaxID=1707 RepID=UPI000B8D9821|nr:MULTISPECIES: DUF6492 family protein [Cellulomonas]ASR56527.1 hypothetical protein CBP52_17100 [Cellulomonas sp. PSBB021]UJP41126.1 hypothetical protein F1D97_06670 [Cellulomonas palmilytica]